MRRPTAIIIAVLAILCGQSTTHAQTLLRCGPFTQDVLAAPEPREARWPVQRFDSINTAVKTQPYRVLFLGDELTEGFDTEVWRQHMAPRGVLNAGVTGDRTEHLLWRLQHGNLAGPPPKAVVLLIGTNDIGHGRSPEVAPTFNTCAGTCPVPASSYSDCGRATPPPDGRLRRGTVAVNRLIQRCGDNGAVVYADIGGVLLDPEGQSGALLGAAQVVAAAEVNAGANVADKCWAARQDCDKDAAAQRPEWRAGYYLAMALNRMREVPNEGADARYNMIKQTAAIYIIWFERAALVSGGDPMGLCHQVYPNTAVCARVKASLAALANVDKRDY